MKMLLAGLALVAVVVAGCAENADTPSAVTTVPATAPTVVAPRPTVQAQPSQRPPASDARGATGCTSSQALETLQAITEPGDALSEVMAKGVSLLLADPSSLAPLIADLTEARDDLSSADIPGCGDTIQRDLVAAFDAMIRGLTDLAAGASSDAVATQFELATEYVTRASGSIQTINPPR